MFDGFRFEVSLAAMDFQGHALAYLVGFGVFAITWLVLSLWLGELGFLLGWIPALLAGMLGALFWWQTLLVLVAVLVNMSRLG